MHYLKELDWEILGLRLALNQKRELFFFDILKPRNVGFFVKFNSMILFKINNISIIPRHGR